MTSTKFKVNINFNLRKPNDIKPTSINAIVRFNGERIVISGIDKIKPSEWRAPLTEGEKPKKGVRYNFPKINVQNTSIISNLKDAEQKIDKAFNDYTFKINRYPETKDEIKDFHAFCKRNVFNLSDPEENIQKEKFKSDSLFDYIELYIKESDPKQTTPPKRTFIYKGEEKQYTDRSRTVWKSMIKTLKDYGLTIEKADLKFIDVNLEFYNGFKDYMTSKKHSQNYFGTIVKYIKKFMNESGFTH